MKFKAVMMLVILVVSLMATGCPNKTTLDNIGAITIAGVDSYILQLDGLRDKGALSDVKHKELKSKRRPSGRERWIFETRSHPTPRSGPAMSKPLWR